MLLLLGGLIFGFSTYQLGFYFGSKLERHITQLLQTGNTVILGTNNIVQIMKFNDAGHMTLTTANIKLTSVDTDLDDEESSTTH